MSKYVKSLSKNRGFYTYSLFYCRILFISINIQISLQLSPWIFKGKILSKPIMEYSGLLYFIIISLFNIFRIVQQKSSASPTISFHIFMSSSEINWIVLSKLCFPQTFQWLNREWLNSNRDFASQIYAIYINASAVLCTRTGPNASATL